MLAQKQVQCSQSEVESSNFPKIMVQNFAREITQVAFEQFSTKSLLSTV